MVSHAYTFAFQQRAQWIALLLKALNKFTIEISCGDLTKKTLVTQEELDKTFALFATFGAKDTDEVVVKTGRLWSNQVFWAMLPKPVFSNGENPKDKSVDEALITIIEAAECHSGLAYNANENVPFEHINYILFAINEKHPIKALYYSPSIPRVDMLLESGKQLSFTDKNISNCQVGYIVDFDDGLSVDQIANYTVSRELKEDFENWKISDMSIDMFRPQIFGSLVKLP